MSRFGDSRDDHRNNHIWSAEFVDDCPEILHIGNNIFGAAMCTGCVSGINIGEMICICGTCGRKKISCLLE